MILPSLQGSHVPYKPFRSRFLLQTTILYPFYSSLPSIHTSLKPNLAHLSPRTQQLYRKLIQGDRYALAQCITLGFVFFHFFSYTFEYS